MDKEGIGRLMRSLTRVLHLVEKLDENLTDARLGALYRSGKVRHASRSMLRECVTRVAEAKEAVTRMYWDEGGSP